MLGCNDVRVCRHHEQGRKRIWNFLHLSLLGFPGVSTSHLFDHPIKQLLISDRTFCDTTMYLYVSEIFPTEIRPIGMGFSLFGQFAGAFRYPTEVSMSLSID